MAQILKPGSKFSGLMTKVFFLDKFPCDQCEYKATHKDTLLRHIRSKHEYVKLPCDQCDYKSTDKVNLIKHIK